MNKINLIAEIGWNHMGNMSLAKKMIFEAKKMVQIFVNSRPGQKKIYVLDLGTQTDGEKFIKRQNYL